jgi:hypothetical protein
LASAVAGFEGGQALADVEGETELALDAVDPGVEPADLGRSSPFMAPISARSEPISARSESISPRSESILAVSSPRRPCTSPRTA